MNEDNQTKPSAGIAAAPTGFSQQGGMVAGDSSTTTSAPPNSQQTSSHQSSLPPVSSLIGLHHSNNNQSNQTMISQQQTMLTNQALQQARYALLLQAAGTVEQQSQQQQQQQQHHPLAAVAALTQHLAKQVLPNNSQNAVAQAAPTAMSSMAPFHAAAAQLLATHATLSATATPAPLANQSSSSSSSRNQSLSNLQHQVNLLHQLKQPVPHTLALLVADARRREEKKTAKRVANRKSASTSRARKKALVQEMTNLNARLRRQALILSLLPDLVIVTNADGVINFCSEQVERVLRHESNVMVGSALKDLLVPSSREKMSKLIKDLTHTDAEGNVLVVGVDVAVDNDDDNGGEGKHPKKEKRQQVSVETCTEETIARKKSKPSGVPLSVVNVDAGCLVAKGTTPPDETDNSDASRDSNKQASSSLTGSTRSPHPCDSDDNKKSKEESKTEAAKSSDKESAGSDDNSNASSLSNDGDAARKLQTANANLERNVRWHNKNMKGGGGSDAGFKDDVIGATVTANNASARLSSLRVQESEDHGLNKEDKNPLSEEDSGYRESNDSREESSSSNFSDSSEVKGGRRKPMAPTCNVCLIRDDLTTIWCEVTSSVRTRYVKKQEVRAEDPMEDDDLKAKTGSSGSGSIESDTESIAREKVREIYLCLRPIRAGRHKVDAKYRFPPAMDNGKLVSEGSKTGQSSGEGSSTNETLEPGSGEAKPVCEFSSIPPKKRKRRDFSHDDLDHANLEKDDTMV